MLRTFCPNCGSNITVEIGDSRVVCSDCKITYQVEVTLGWRVIHEVDGKEDVAELASFHLEELQNGKG